MVSLVNKSAPQRTTGSSSSSINSSSNSNGSSVKHKNVDSLWERVIQRRRLQLTNELTIGQRTFILEQQASDDVIVNAEQGATCTATESILQVLVRHYQVSSNPNVSPPHRQKSLVALRTLLSRIDDQRDSSSNTAATTKAVAATICATPGATTTPPPTKTHRSANDTTVSSDSSSNSSSRSSDDDLPIGTLKTTTHLKQPNPKSGESVVTDCIIEDDNDKDDLPIATSLPTKQLTTPSVPVLLDDTKKSTFHETSVPSPSIAPCNDATATQSATPIPSVAATPAADITLVHQEKIATSNVAPSQTPPSSTPIVGNNNNNNNNSNYTNQTKATKQVDASIESLSETLVRVRKLAPGSIIIGNVQGNNTTEKRQEAATTKTVRPTTPYITPSILASSKSTATLPSGSNSILPKPKDASTVALTPNEGSTGTEALPNKPPESLLSTGARGLESSTISKRASSDHPPTTVSSVDKGDSSTTGIEKESIVNTGEKSLSTASTPLVNQNPEAPTTTSSRTETVHSSFTTPKISATKISTDAMGVLLSKTRKRTSSPSEIPLSSLSDVSSRSSSPPPQTTPPRKSFYPNTEVIEILDSPVSIQKAPPVQIQKAPVPKIAPPVPKNVLPVPKKASPISKIIPPVQVSKQAILQKKAAFVADSYNPTFSGTLATRKAISLEYNAGDDKKTGSRLYSDQAEDMNVRFERWDPYWKVEQDCGCSMDYSGQMWGLSTGKVLRITAGSRASMPFTAFSLELKIPYINSMRQVDWGGPRQSGAHSFTNGESRLIMRMLPLHRSDYEKKKKADTPLWPKGTFVQLNSTPLPILERRQQSHDHALWKGMCHVLDLTPFVRNPFRPNILSVCTQDPDRYCVQIAVCKYVSSPALFEEIKSSKENRLVRNMSYEESLALASKHTSSAMVVLDSDDESDGGGEAETGADNHSLTFTLVCPISMQLMKTPVRGKNCKHMQCFDLSMFLQTNETVFGGRWRCAVCEDFLCLDEMVQCGLFTKMLETYADEASVNRDKVQFHADGTWKLMPENKLRYGSKKRSNDSTDHGSGSAKRVKDESSNAAGNVSSPQEIIIL